MSPSPSCSTKDVKGLMPPSGCSCMLIFSRTWLIIHSETVPNDSITIRTPTQSASHTGQKVIPEPLRRYLEDPALPVPRACFRHLKCQQAEAEASSRIRDILHKINNPLWAIARCIRWECLKSCRSASFRALLARITRWLPGAGPRPCMDFCNYWPRGKICLRSTCQVWQQHPKLRASLR